MPSSQPALSTTADLPDDESHHLRDVLRIAEGGELVVIDRASGQSYLAVVAQLRPAVQFKIVRDLGRSPSRSKVETLACALLKGDHNELVCEKVCELGAQSIVFWQADHSVVRLNEKSAENKLRRLETIISSAARQSYNTHPPKLILLSNTDELIEHLNLSSALNCYCSLSEGTKSFADIKNADGANILVGPEGDFSDKEEEKFKAANWQPITLGPTVLRAETAAIAAVASANAVFGFSSL